MAWLFILVLILFQLSQLGTDIYTHTYNTQYVAPLHDTRIRDVPKLFKVSGLCEGQPEVAAVAQVVEIPSRRVKRVRF